MNVWVRGKELIKQEISLMLTLPFALRQGVPRTCSFVEGLVFTVTHLWWCIDEFYFDLFYCEILCLGKDALSQDDWSLSGSNNTSSYHDEIVVDFTVVWNPPIGVMFFSMASASVVALFLTTSWWHQQPILNTFLFISVLWVVSQLTSSSNSGPLNGSWMPGSDTTNLPANLCESFSGSSGYSESLYDSVVFPYPLVTPMVSIISFSCEDFADADFSFWTCPDSPVDLVGNSASVNLNLVRGEPFSVWSLTLTSLGVKSETLTTVAVLSDSVEISLDWIFLESVSSVWPSLSILGECLLLCVETQFL